MKRVLYTLLISVLFLNVTACSSDPSTTSADSTPRAVAAGADKVEPAAKMVIPVGTRIRVALLNAVSSDKSRAGDQFMASLSEPVIIDGKTILPKGTKLRGRVMDAAGSGRVKGRASLQLTLMQIVREDGNISILTKPYTAVAESTKKRDAAVIGGGAGLGAAIGAMVIDR